MKKLRLRETKATYWRSLYSQEVAEPRSEPKTSEIRVQTPDRLVRCHSARAVLCCFYKVKGKINSGEFLMSEKLFSELQQYGLVFTRPERFSP